MRSSAESQSGIAVIRLSAMGDIIHTLPAAASLKQSFPDRKLVWIVAPRWMPLLEGNPYIDELVPFERSGFGALKSSWRRLRKIEAGLVLDFQGLVYSALLARAIQPEAIYGFHRSVARESLASLFYTHRIPVRGPHRVERNVQLVEAAGGRRLTHTAWIPPGAPEDSTPEGPFILAAPFAGWAGKEWPLEKYEALGKRLHAEGIDLVANIPAHRAGEVMKLKHVRPHTSTIRGLIAATRSATAVLGVDSGPLHLAAALGKPGVGLFGPTDPACTGPYGGSMSVIRAQDVKTTYKRHARIHASMRAISVDQVFRALIDAIHKAADGPASSTTAAAVAVTQT